MASFPHGLTTSGPSPVHIQLGMVKIDANRQAIFGAETSEMQTTIDTGQTKSAWVRVPAGGFAIRVVVDRKVVPDDYNHAGSDNDGASSRGTGDETSVTGSR